MSDPLDTEAKFANRVAITMNSDGMRIAFGEGFKANEASEDKIRYFDAVFLPTHWALAMRDLMTEALQQQMEIEKLN